MDIGSLPDDSSYGCAPSVKDVVKLLLQQVCGLLHTSIDNLEFWKTWNFEKLAIWKTQKIYKNIELFGKVEVSS